MSYVGYENKNTQRTHTVPFPKITAKFVLIRESSIEGDDRVLVIRGAQYREILLSTLFNQCQQIKGVVFKDAERWYNGDKASILFKGETVMVDGGDSYYFAGVTYSVIETSNILHFGTDIPIVTDAAHTICHTWQ